MSIAARMMRMRLILAVATLMPLVCSAAAQSVSAPNASAQNPGQWSPVGLWQAVDSDTKRPTGWFLIDDHNGVFDGIIAKMFLKPGEDPNTICDKCKDDRKDHTWLGLEIIRGMKPEGENKYGDGTILDPRDGKIYKATMKGHARRADLGRARLYRVRIARAEPILDAPAGFRLQRARSVGESAIHPQSRAAAGASPDAAQIRNRRAGA